MRKNSLIEGFLLPIIIVGDQSSLIALLLELHQALSQLGVTPPAEK